MKKLTEGKYLNGKKNGPGFFKFSNGDFLKCDWKDGVQDGEGIINENGEERNVTWSNGNLLRS